MEVEHEIEKEMLYLGPHAREEGRGQLINREQGAAHAQNLSTETTNRNR